MQKSIRMGRVSGWLACFVVLGLGVAGTNQALERRIGTSAPSGDVGVLPDGETVRVLSLGFDRLIADLFWLRAIYYVGDDRSAAAGYPAAARLANLVTDVDPTFATAYVVMSGAVGLLQRNPDESIALLEKGVRNVDDYWKLNFLLGFSYFSERGDFVRAAQQMELAARKGGPKHLALLSARLYANGGDPDTALLFIAARIREEEEENARKALEKRYVDLWIARDLARIDAAIEARRNRTGQTAVTIEELVSGGDLRGGLRDPQGGTYRIEDGRAVSDLPHDPLDLNVPYNPTIPAGGVLKPPAGVTGRGARP